MTFGFLLVGTKLGLLDVVGLSLTWALGLALGQLVVEGLPVGASGLGLGLFEDLDGSFPASISLFAMYLRYIMTPQIKNPDVKRKTRNIIIFRDNVFFCFTKCLLLTR